MSWKKNFPFWDLSKWYRYSPPHPDEELIWNSASKKGAQKRRRRTKSISKRISPTEPPSIGTSPQELQTHATQTEDANAYLAKRTYPPSVVPRAPLQAVLPAAMPERFEEHPIHEWPAHHAGQPGAYNDPRFTANQQATNYATRTQYPGAYGREPYGVHHDASSLPVQEPLQRTYDKARSPRAPSNEVCFTRTCVLVAICMINASIVVAMLLLFLSDAMFSLPTASPEDTAETFATGINWIYRYRTPSHSTLLDWYEVVNISDYRYRDPYHQTACVFHGSADGLAISNDGVHFGLSRFPFAFCRLAIFCCPPLGENLEPQDADDLATEFARRALKNNPVVHAFMMLGDGSDAGKAQFTALEKDLAAGVLAPDAGKRYKAWSYTGVVLRWPETTPAAAWHKMAPLLRELSKKLASPSYGLSLGVALRQDSFGADMEHIAANLGKTYLFLLPPAVDNYNPLALRYYSHRTLAALDGLNLRFLSHSLSGRQCYLFPADTYTYRIKPPDTTHSLGPGIKGPRTESAGRMAYFETCQIASTYSKLFTDYGVEALQNDSLLVYTEPQLLAHFADYMHKSLSATCMGIWNPHMDDLGGVCGFGVYPLSGALFRYYNDTH